MLEVLTPGLLTTVQDLGRPAAVRFGVPPGGACDPRSLAVANLLLGNPAGAAALELTAVGPELVATEACVIALAGADLGARIEDEARELRPGAAHLVRAGSHITFRTRPDRPAAGGFRAYLAVPGGIDVPEVLGSRSTYLRGGFGGLEGRPIRAGDRIRSTQPGDLGHAGRRWPGRIERWAAPTRTAIRLVSRGSGPTALGGGLSPRLLELVLAGAWRVDPTSDRQGLRLVPATTASPLPEERVAAAGDLLSIPVTWGAIQVPPDDRPIVLLADHQTVGGYAVPAVVARVDLPTVGQLAPGDEIAFVLVTVPEAQRAWREDMAAFRTAVAELGRGDSWDGLLLALDS